MSQKDFNAPAELYSSGTHRAGRFSGLKYRRFATFAEAIKYAVEEIPAQLNFATIEVGETSFRGADIRRLYGSDEFPLAREETGQQESRMAG